MIVVRFLVNLVILAVELGLIAGVVVLARTEPLAFAAVTALLALGLGLRLEYERLSNEVRFYFEGGHTPSVLLMTLVSSSEALLKALLAGVVALMTVSGTDTGRLQMTSLVIGGCLFAGTSLLRRLSISLHAIPSRWGYFRIAVPLGLMFSVALAFWPPTDTVAIGRKILLETPAIPSLAQASELLFLIKQKLNELLVALIAALGAREWAPIIGIVVSANVLTGFVIGIYAVVIAEIVRRLEHIGWR